MKFNQELLIVRGVIASLDDHQQVKIAECHKKIKDIIEEYAAAGLFALSLYSAEVTAEQS